VRINDDSGGDSEPGTENDAGGLSADAGELDEEIERGGDFAAVAFNECECHSADIFGFSAEEAEWFDDGFDVGLAGECEGMRVGEASEKFRRGLVHAFVGALCGENRGGEELEGGVVVESAVGGGEELCEFADDLGGACFAGSERFAAAAFGGWRQCGSSRIFGGDFA